MATIHGIDVEVPIITCDNCGYHGEANIRYLESNQAMQKRCPDCGKYHGNHPYATAETYIMPFGAHRGEKLIDLPRDYLRWLYKNCDLSDNLYEAIEKILEDEVRL
jgi:endogenous inhibitor of DNA gyrase (YacG/DUF329 family)